MIDCLVQSHPFASRKLAYSIQVSPPRYPCDADGSGVTEELMPNVYWSNAVPDSDASVRLTIS